MSTSIYVLTKNNSNVGFVASREQALDWLDECKEKCTLDPDHSFTFKMENDHTLVVYGSYKWVVIRYYRFEDVYTFAEVPMYV